MSLPCILGESGVLSLIRQQLNDEERNKIQKSADKMFEVQKMLHLNENNK